MFRSVILAFGLTLAAAPASAFIAENGLIVRSDGGDDFVVPWRGNSQTRAFWCAAGDYVRDVLGRDGQTRIYRTSGRRGPGEGIAFSLSPIGAQPTGLLFWSNETGLSVAHAVTFCRLPNPD